MHVFWFIPTTGDGRYLGDSRQARETNFSYLKQISTAIDERGFEGVLLPTGNLCEDAWVVASSVMPFTRRLKFLVAVRPTITSVTLAARMAATFDRLSKGRLLINVVAGGDPGEAVADGVFADHDERYAITDEFLDIWKRLLAGGGKVSHKGKYLHIEGAQVYYPAVQKPHPPLYLGGSSEAAIRVAAKHVDPYLTWGEPPAHVAAKISRVRAAAAAEGRTVRFGMRLHIIVRETAEEAWDAANNLIRHVKPEAVQQAQQRFAGMDSEGQRRQSELIRSSEGLEVSPNLWAGVGLLRRGAATSLVGDPETVAQRMREYAELGIETFILSGYPHLEEAYRVAELLFPLLPLSHAHAAETFRLPLPEDQAGNEFRPGSTRSS